jgi:hypothetical protein
VRAPPAFSKMKKTTIPMATFSALNPRDRADFIRFGGEVSDAPVKTPIKALTDAAAETIKLRYEAKAALAMCGLAVGDARTLTPTADGIRAVRGAHTAIRRRLEAEMTTRERINKEDFVLEALAGKHGTTADILVSLGALEIKPDGSRIYRS